VRAHAQGDKKVGWKCHPKGQGKKAAAQQVDACNAPPMVVTRVPGSDTEFTVDTRPSGNNLYKTHGRACFTEGGECHVPSLRSASWCA